MTISSTPLSLVVGDARRCLARSHVVTHLRAQTTTLLVTAAVCAASRPIVWPLASAPVSHALLRTIILGATGTLVVAAGIALHAWRSRPSMLGAARSLDSALGLSEVVASGYAFERDRKDEDPVVAIAIARARKAATNVALSRVLAPSRPALVRRRVAGAALALVIGLAIGAVDRLAIENVVHPVTKSERASAEELKKAAAEAAASIDPKDPNAQKMLDAAQRAAAAAERGDRKAAEEALEEFRKASRAADEADHEKARELRSLRDELEGGRPGPKGERPATSAGEALEKTMRELDAAKDDPDAVKKLAERLARAEAAAHAAAGKPSNSSAGKTASESAWSAAEKALAEAREAAAKGDAAGAKAAMAKAEAAIAELEKKKGAAGAMAKMADGASSLGDAMRDGGEGKEASKLADGKGTGEKRDAKKGGEPQKGATGQPGGGDAPGDRSPGSEQHRLKVNGNLQARTDVHEGERAVSALEGVGKGGDQKALREVFPAYDTAVEDGLREDLVPAARRPAVRRYFSLIRPGEEEKPQ